MQLKYLKPWHAFAAICLLYALPPVLERLPAVLHELPEILEEWQRPRLPPPHRDSP
jgi:hypothetical protein